MSLKQKVLTGTKWITLANIFRQVQQIISLIIFAKLLTPDDFGMFAILMIFVGFMRIFTDMGTGAALIQIKNPSEELLSSVFYFNLFVGLVLCVSLILISGPIALFFEIPTIKDLLQIISISFIFTSFGVVQKVLYEKHLNFKTVTIIETFSGLVGLVVGISAAYYGLGVLSFVLQALSTSFLGVVLIWIYSDWKPMFHFALVDIKHIWEFTKNLSIFNFVNYFARNADNFLIGKFLGSPALGVYSVAYRIMLYPLQNISRTLLRVLFPAFAQIQDDNEKFQKVYLRVIFFISLITFPLMTGLMATADVLITVLFEDKWENLSILLILLSPIGMMQAIVTTTGSIFMAKGNMRTFVRLSVFCSIVTVVFFVAGLPFGVEGVAFFYLISNFILLYPILKISWDQIDLSVKRGIVEVLPILIISIIMGIGVYLADFLLFQNFQSQFFRLILMMLTGAFLYISMIRIHYGNIKSLISELRK